MSIPTPAAPRSRRRARQVNQWHRTAGICAVLVLVYLIATGLPLQFSAELQLGQRHVASDWVLDWYGLQAPDDAEQSGAAVALGGTLFLGESEHVGLPRLVGAMPAGDALAVAAPHELWLFHRGVQDPERTSFDPTITRIGNLDDRIFLDTTGGLLEGDHLLMNWTRANVSADAIDWAGTTSLTPGDALPYRERFRRRMLTLERWLQDLHSGRFFGTPGVVVVDVASLLMLILAGTGIALWLRSRRS
ncbi:MAG: hypothetical protein GWM88_08305 [Pseudomonadales bacterium]|nr:PepSY domain-containing protein [Pseudomonadales bacterium]NIX08005.1 hypothetical protein [Pseudomonadales bacterium]